MRTAQFLAALAALSSVSAAWPDVFNFDEVKAVAHANVERMIYGRQNNNNNNNNNSESPRPSATEPPRSSGGGSSARPSETGSSNKESASGSASVTDSPQPSGSNRVVGGGNRTQTFGPHAQAGGIQMVTPGPFAGEQFYKIGDNVTFAWNFTSLSVTPSAVDVLATASLNKATYTIAVNQTTEGTPKVVWDTRKDQDGVATPLVMDMYTLVIYDSQSSVSAAPVPGYLSTFNQFKFGMYLKQNYVDRKDYKCVTCNGALSAYETSVLKLFFFTGGTTIASLLYFAYSFGLF